jgi:hypothetical protein
MNANIVKMQIFHKIKYDLRGHSRSQIMTFLIKKSPFLLFMLLIDWKNKCCWTLWKNKVWHIQIRHLPCFDLNLRSYGQLFVLVLLSFQKLYKDKCTRAWMLVISAIGSNSSQRFHWKITFFWKHVFSPRHFSYITFWCQY